MFRNFVVVGIERWLEVITDWIEQGKDVYFIFYEDLADAPTAEIRKLLNYLKLNIDEDRLRCIELHSSGSFHRKRHQAEDPFRLEDHNKIDAAIEKANNLLRDEIKRELPLEKYEYYKQEISSVNPERSSK